MGYTPNPFNYTGTLPNQVQNDLSLANDNFNTLAQAFVNNDPTTGQVKVADKVDGYDASKTPTANTIPVSDSSGKIADGWLNFVANDPKVKIALNASGDAPIYACRTWVNFDGTTSPPTIRASANVSSVVKNATGNYTVNFATALPSQDYSLIITTGMLSTGTNAIRIVNVSSLTTTSCQFVTTPDYTLGGYDAAVISVCIII